ncbi:helix-turn-helix domain-containing protein [Paenibacillus graminis]|uniref:response regulator transcription factor n=1 Tax=Paenibacillus graminis TaxID=189425 RepID=UPI002DBD7E90|nr:helix-turn-helix domain-containing protein [Paenibacillus graminis]MEC0168578.1 helix-turn-helix domain-containing protein [Paenibacillus graminis]
MPIIRPIFSSNDFDLARKALMLHVSDYLKDPVEPAELARSLEAVKRKLVSPNSPFPSAQAVHEAVAGRVPSSSSSIIEEIKLYVEKQLHRNITLKRISDVLDFNCAYLGQKFKQHENMSFNEYLLLRRMEKAKLLLETTEMKIYEIADAVGYTEIDWFYKKFKEYTGTSANKYRKQCFITA